MVYSQTSSFTILTVLSAYPTCSHTAAMFTSTFPYSSATFSNSMSISIMCILKRFLTYNSITLFQISLCNPAVRLLIWFLGTNLSLLSYFIMISFPMTNIISDMSVINLCSLYKYSVIFMYSSVSTLIGLFLTVFPLIVSSSVPQIYFTQLMSCVLIGQFCRIFSCYIFVFLFLSVVQPFLAVHVQVWRSPSITWYNLQTFFVLVEHPSLHILSLSVPCTAYNHNLQSHTWNWSFFFQGCAGFIIL